MEVLVRAGDFHFDSARTSPYGSSPSSPRGFAGGGDFYTSAPTSPTRAAAIYHHLRHQSASTSVIPFHWEDTPGTPKHRESADKDGGAVAENQDEPVDFAFDFSGQLVSGIPEGRFTATADELFEAGKIRTLKLPPRLQQVPSSLKAGAAVVSPRSPKSPASPISRLFRSPRRGGEDGDFDPFEKAIQETTRGRERTNSIRGSRRATRSLSTFRNVFDCASSSSSTIAAAGKSGNTNNNNNNNPSANPSRSGKKWRLRDLLLFRSASEGRVSGKGRKDPMRKYTALSPAPSAALLSKASGDDVRSSSFRSTDSGGSSRRGASPHEVHYTENRAASQELRRKTPLAYRSGLLGWLGFSDPTLHGRAVGRIGVHHRS